MAAAILPSMPRLPKPPGTRMPLAARTCCRRGRGQGGSRAAGQEEPGGCEDGSEARVCVVGKGFREVGREGYFPPDSDCSLTLAVHSHHRLPTSWLHRLCARCKSFTPHPRCWVLGRTGSRLDGLHLLPALVPHRLPPLLSCFQPSFPTLYHPSAPASSPPHTCPAPPPCPPPPGPAPPPRSG